MNDQELITLYDEWLAEGNAPSANQFWKAMRGRNPKFISYPTLRKRFHRLKEQTGRDDLFNKEVLQGMAKMKTKEPASIEEPEPQAEPEQKEEKQEDGTVPIPTDRIDLLPSMPPDQPAEPQTQPQEPETAPSGEGKPIDWKRMQSYIIIGGGVLAGLLILSSLVRKNRNNQNKGGNASVSRQTEPEYPTLRNPYTGQNIVLSPDARIRA